MHDDGDDGSGRWSASGRSSRLSAAARTRADAPLDPSHEAGAPSSRPLASPPSSAVSPVRSNPSSAAATSPPMTHARPPSALSSASSSTHPHAFPSPRLHHQSLYAPSSFNSAAAFDYDDLLGPRPSHLSATTSGTSVSPPSSNEDDKRRVQGLGFSASPRAGVAELYEGDGEIDEPHRLHRGHDEDEDDDDDERWMHLTSMRLGSALPTPPLSSPPSNPSSLSNPPPSHSHSASRQSSATAIGSPLSPLVAPFAPAAQRTQGTAQVATATPWSVGISGGFAERAAREREASWNSAASSTFASQAQQRAFPTLTSPSSFTPSSSSTLQQQTPHFSSSHASHGFTPSLAYAADSPATSQPMSESGSRDGGGIFIPMRQPLRAGEIHVDRAGYVRSGYVERAPPPPPGTGSGSSSTEAGGALPSDLNIGGDVSTIFVIGFPDDMHEREFQNMFVFADGFEAAALKVPLATAAARGEVPSSAASAGGPASVAGSDLAAEQQEPVSTGAPLPLEAFPPLPGLPPHLNPALPSKDQVALARDAAAAGESGASLSSGTSVNGSTASSTSASAAAAAARRQIIGFARFSTRQQALDAVERISGKKVDAERGSVLKAEMAKKNLHTKRTILGPVTPASTSSGGLAGGASQEQIGRAAFTPQRTGTPVAQPSTVSETAASVAAAATTAATTMGGSGPSIPLSALDASTLAKLAQTSNLNPAVLAEIARQSAAAAASSAVAPARAEQQQQQAVDTLGAVHDAFQSLASRIPGRDYYELDAPGVLGGYGAGPASAASASPPHRAAALGAGTASSGAGAFVGQRGLLQQLDEGLPGAFGAHTREASYASSTAAAGPYSTYTSPGPGAAPLSPQLGATAVPTARQAAMHPLGSPQLGFASPLGGVPRTQNPADMNAPKNTLYVGGLPAVLPSLTGPFSASHLEDSLRNAFSRCPGYKRLQFRYKSNGPIVFVEFVDTPHATRAMQELYGHTLGGLVKGGIRLSYSKNPLGVRSNGLPSGNPPPLDPSNPLAQQQPQQQGGIPSSQGPPLGFASSSFVGSPVGGPTVPSFEPIGFDPHRRPPDPIYGETAYPPPPMRSPSISQMPSSSPFAASSGFVGGSGGGGGGGGVGSHTPGPLTPGQYAGAFSPFGIDV
ncbi:hypothetical protein Rhopal_005191-T1 [Rhodotorula paludigena]|uniref:RRM domain-containing protein n=1 Tax=Rhodotorula paludigena TaxID=86838 RepID=A0AAV5GHN9_9BASI|nr:hypothetical protein Rhopal_005191-T1 [Rhodotorula paludigena]